MAKLALLTFALVILNSTVRINADFQLITVLYKLIESVEQLNSSISKINGRLDKLEDTIPTRPEYIKPDPEPMHGRVDEKVKKALESEKVLIRKSLSVYENKFQLFEAQVNRHLSSMYTAIESKKDKVDEQMLIMNENLDRKSDALHVQQEIRQINATFDRTKDKLDEQIRLMNESLDRKSDALHVQQEIRQINATFDRTKDKVDEQMLIMNETLDRKSDALHVHQEIQRINATFEQLYNTLRCSYSPGTFQLYNGNTELNIVEHNSLVEVKCKNGHNYEMKNTETDQYIDSLNAKCLFGQLDKDLSVLKCLPKQCFNDNSKIALYTGDRNTRVVTHTSKVDVKCTDDGYEMKNTQTVKYERNLTTTCTFGKIDYQISQLTCLPRRPNIKYSVRLKVSDFRGEGVKVNMRIVGNGQTAELQLNGVYYDWKLKDLDFTKTDVRPIQSVVVNKDRAIPRDLSMEYVSIYIEENEEYYVFTGTSLHTNLTDIQPLTLTLSDHPEKCSSHTYGEALERSPRGTRINYVGLKTLHGCKTSCITTHSIKCKSVYFIPYNKESGKGLCHHNEHSPDDDIHFRDNDSYETNRGDVSYERICKTT